MSMCLSILFAASSCIDDEELIDRSCPDTNHPHMIDLGLPSGSKWACCNVGATNPEEYGGHYAWGETEVKDVYNWSTYTHCDGTAYNCYNIGDNIAGTKYDVAHEKWRGSWRMPSADQIKELCIKCSWTWTTKHGVQGYMVKGKKNAIFLPAAGFYCSWRDNLVGGNSVGHYWSSSLDSEEESSPFWLTLSSGLWDCYNYGIRSQGLSVRAVCP